MNNLIRHITIDCADPYALGTFWAEALGSTLAQDDRPGDPEALVELGSDVPNLLFVQVPEPKTVKNRVHLDLMPLRHSRDEEIERLVELGATELADHRRVDGRGWMVMADPEGNEFCVEISRDERARSM